MEIERALNILAIQEKLTEYCHAIDFRNFDDLDHVFTPDAVLDYRQVGGPKGDLPTTKAWLKKALSRFGAYSHIAANPMIRFDGDAAWSRSVLFNPMPIPQETAAPHVFFCGGWYEDDWIKTGEGWRISKRVERSGYFHNLPEGFTPESA